MSENNFFVQNKFRKIAYDISLFCLIALFLSGAVFLFVQIRNSAREYKYIGRTPESIKTMNFTGEGKVNAKPDIAMVSMGLTVEKKTVAEAQKESSEKMNAFIKSVKDMGVKEEDIKTTNYNVYPQYNWVDGRQYLRAYSLSQNVELKIRDLDKISDIIGLAGQYNLNQIQDLTFDVDKKDEFLKQAKEEAIEKAKANAEETAKLLGISLGRIVSYNEYNNNIDVYNGYRLQNSYAKVMDESAGVASPEISAGNAELTVNVNIVYELN